MAANVERILVLGSGIMGAGIAQVAAQAGFDTTLYDVDEAILAKARAKLLDSVGRAVAKGKLPAGTKEEVDRRLKTTLDLDAAARETQFVIEAVPEKLDLKRDLFARIEKAAGPDVVLTTNTSSLMISEIAAALRDPGRLIGMHFFNPVPVMRLVEIILGPEDGRRRGRGDRGGLEADGEGDRARQGVAGVHDLAHQRADRERVLPDARGRASRPPRTSTRR